MFLLLCNGKEALKGLVYNNPISSMDIMATICDLANIKTKNKLDGVNLIPFLKNEKNTVPHDRLFWRKWGTKCHGY